MLCKAANTIRALSLTVCSASLTLNIAAALISTQSSLQDCDREARDWAARAGQHNQYSTSTTHHQAGMPSSAILNRLSACRFGCSTSSTLSPLPRWKILRRRHRVASGNVHPARPAASSISSCATLIAMTIAAGRIRWPSLAKRRLWIRHPSPLTSTFRLFFLTPQPSSRLPSTTNRKVEARCNNMPSLLPTLSRRLRFRQAHSSTSLLRHSQPGPAICKATPPPPQRCHHRLSSQPPVTSIAVLTQYEEPDHLFGLC